MTDLPFLVRRVLRFVALHKTIDRSELELLADLGDAGIQTETSLLIMRGLISRGDNGRTYSLTAAGAQCVDGDPSPLKESTYDDTRHSRCGSPVFHGAAQHTG
jgi:hypothetical protein